MLETHRGHVSGCSACFCRKFIERNNKEIAGKNSILDVKSYIIIIFFSFFFINSVDEEESSKSIVWHEQNLMT